MSSVSLVNFVASHLQENLTDPNKVRGVKYGASPSDATKWVIEEWPHIQSTVEPAILVSCPTSPNREIGFNANSDFEEEHLINLVIQVSAGLGIVYEGGTRKTPEELIGLIEPDVRDELKLPATIIDFEAAGFKKPHPVSSGLEPFTDDGFLKHRMVYRVRERRD